MAAVSTLPSGRGFRTDGSGPQNPNAWDCAGRSKQEVSLGLRYLYTSASMVLYRMFEVTAFIIEALPLCQP